MRKLDRSSVQEPSCLKKYNADRQTWDDIRDDKPAIRQALGEMQGWRCAYCEESLDVERHIDHFRPKMRYRELTFAWTNLFLSCDSKDSCGHYKDGAGKLGKGYGAAKYDPRDLVDPCIEDPSEFLYFHSDGSVRQRRKLPAEKARRAAETLRVFNLNHTTLMKRRRQVADDYHHLLDSLAECDDVERLEKIQKELELSSGKPFSAVIRHVLEQL